MKLTPNPRNVDNTGTQNHHLGIKASAEAFEILSAGLYSNRPLAIIRELTANAWDAHVLAGREDQAVEVDLPNELNSTLRFRDYGYGLSTNAMYNVFAVYFGGDKGDSNQLIGGMGLGCKSPLSYTDSFTVISRYQGKRSTFQVYLDTESMPTMTLLHEVDTLEPSGLEILIPIKTGDFYTFRRNANTCLRWFPNVKLNGQQQEPMQYLHRTEHYGVPNCDDIHEPHVLSGNILYPISIRELPEHYEQRYELSKLPIVLFAPIGAVKPAASRETLSYNPATKEWLTKAITDCTDNLRDDILNLVQAEPDLYAAQQRYWTLNSKYGSYFSAIRDRSTPIEWHDPNNGETHRLYANHQLQTSSLNMDDCVFLIQRKPRRTRSSNNNTATYNLTTQPRQVISLKTPVFVYNPKTLPKLDASRRIKHYVENNWPSDASAIPLLTTEQYAKLRTPVLKNLGNVDVNRLPDPPTTYHAPTRTGKPRQTRPTRLKYFGNSSYMREIDSDDEALRNTANLYYVNAYNTTIKFSSVTSRILPQPLEDMPMKNFEPWMSKLRGLLKSDEKLRLVVVPASKSLPQNLKGIPHLVTKLEALWTRLMSRKYSVTEAASLQSWIAYNHAWVDAFADTAPGPLRSWAEQRQEWRQTKDLLDRYNNVFGPFRLHFFNHLRDNPTTTESPAMAETQLAEKYGPIDKLIRNGFTCHGGSHDKPWTTDQIIALATAIDTILEPPK